MDTNKNLYTIIYATVLVVLVAVILALASYLLKDRQQRNVAIETKQMILKAVHLAQDPVKLKKDKDNYIESEYAKYIKDTSITEGNKTLPLYICNIDSSRYYIIPLHGTGLWGPIWGYIALKSDFNTVYGAVFDHKGETPGLGAEIATAKFQEQFTDKTIFEGDNFVSISVVKGGATKGDPHQIDAISGGTITSRALEAMLKTCISEYLDFFKNK
jgi:Na+-transporting NADH:ubiquinone oxidoreductase subunit C